MMDTDRSGYDELDDAIAQRREQSLLEDEIGALKVQLRDIKREADDEIGLLKRHVGRLELSQNKVLTMVDQVQARMDEIEAEGPAEREERIGFWMRIKVRLANLWK